MITLSGKAGKMMSVFDTRSWWRLVMTSMVGGLKEGGGLKGCKHAFAGATCVEHRCRNCEKMKA